MNDEDRNLTKTETVAAIAENVVNFPKMERVPIDPPIAAQTFCLHSFVPMKFECDSCKSEVTPPKGFYGLFKCRGCFPDEASAKRQYEHLIRAVDSRNKISVGYTGHWLPLTQNLEDFSHDVEEIDINQRCQQATLEQTKDDKTNDQQIMKELKEREQELYESVAADADTSSMDYYIEQRVKKGSLLYMIEQCDMKKRQAARSLKAVNKVVNNLERDHPTYTSQYRQKYYDARRKAGIPDDAPDPTCLMKNRPEFEHVKPSEIGVKKTKEKSPAQIQIEREQKEHQDKLAKQMAEKVQLQVVEENISADKIIEEVVTESSNPTYNDESLKSYEEPVEEPVVEEVVEEPVVEEVVEEPVVDKPEIQEQTESHSEELAMSNSLEAPDTSDDEDEEQPADPMASSVCL